MSAIGPLQDRESLLMRSAVCRLRLHRDLRALRGSLDWRRAIVATAQQPFARHAAFALALSIVGARRATRLIVLAGRVLVALKVGRALLRFVRDRTEPGCAIEQTGPGVRP